MLIGIYDIFIHQKNGMLYTLMTVLELSLVVRSYRGVVMEDGMLRCSCYASTSGLQLFHVVHMLTTPALVDNGQCQILSDDLCPYDMWVCPSQTWGQLRCNWNRDIVFNCNNNKIHYLSMFNKHRKLVECPDLGLMFSVVVHRKYYFGIGIYCNWYFMGGIGML